MKLQIDRIDQHELTGFINRVKLIDSFVYMKIRYYYFINILKKSKYNLYEHEYRNYNISYSISFTIY